MEPDRKVEDYRGHKLVAAKSGAEYSGVVWSEGARLQQIKGSNLQDVLTELRCFVDREIDETAARRRGLPLEEEYLRAFTKIVGRLSDGQLAMLKAHWLAPDQALTAVELAAAAGYADYSAANLQYGIVGKMLYEILPTKLHTRRDGTPVYTSALAVPGGRTEDENHWTWKLRPEIAYVIQQLGLAT